jgi:hypothetical protein
MEVATRVDLRHYCRGEMTNFARNTIEQQVLRYLHGSAWLEAISRLVAVAW